MFQTKLTDLLGVEYPIQCGTMQWISRAELVAAVSNAGGFACLAAATFPNAKELSDEIKKTMKLTNKPFGVNVSLFPTLRPQIIEDLIQVVVDEGVKILETAGRNPVRYRQKITDAGLIHVHKCARLKDAMKMSSMGVDAVAVVGTESGGHPGMSGVTSMVLAPLVADSISIPLIVGGGICDGRSLVAGLALGADGVVMGTRFLCTKECIIHPEIKKKLLMAEATDTMLVLESLQNPGRVLRNRLAEKVCDSEQSGKFTEEIVSMIKGEITLHAWLEGKIDEGLFACGQAVGRINDVPSVSELIDMIIEDARSVRKRLDVIIGG